MRLPLCLLALVFAAGVAGALEIPPVFTDGAVLQCDAPVPVWGRAEPGRTLSVSFAGQRHSAKAGEDGRWMVRLRPMKASRRPRPMVVKGAGSGRIVIEDVLVGEVWICSGQSNMAWPVRSSNDAKAEIAAAKYPRLRLITVPRRPIETPQHSFKGAWVACGPKTVASFSAVGYFFGREIHRELKVPVGLINTSYGGTPAEAWTSRGALEAEERLVPLLARWKKSVDAYDPEKAKAGYAQRLATWKKAVEAARAEGRKPPRRPRAPTDPRVSPHRPANLYNGMIAPLVPFAVRGAIWYQGESNAGRAEQYRTIFPTMIRDWRRTWGRDDLPFLFVQLANFKKASDVPGDSAWAEIRDAQAFTLRTVPATGMAVAIDIGAANDIHPRNKQDVGRRLALWALARTYGRDLVCSGPVYRGSTRRGNEMVIAFDHVGAGLVADGELRGFAIAGADRVFTWGTARIEGDTVVVSHPDVAEPASVRYAWADNPPCSLRNAEGLPASPFRTDDWPGVTAGKD
jgi:sialate O-acetylesterase